MPQVRTISIRSKERVFLGKRAKRDDGGLVDERDNIGLTTTPRLSQKTLVYRSPLDPLHGRLPARPTVPDTTDSRTRRSSARKGRETGGTAVVRKGRSRAL